MNKKNPILLKYLTILTIVFLYFPIIISVIYSFNESSSGIKFSAISLKWYYKLFNNSELRDAVKYTLIIGFLSSFIATAIGILGSYVIYRSRKVFKNTLLFSNSIPIINPDLITGVGLFILFMFIGLKLGFTSLLLAHISFNIPYAVITIYPRLSSLSRYSIEAAYDLGASETQTFTKIILPQLKSSIFSSLLICFTLSIDDFIISFFTTGNHVTNLSMFIYAAARRGVDPSINALSTIMFIIIFTLLLIINTKNSLKELEK